MDFSIPAKKMVYHPLSRLVPLFIQQRYDTNPAVRSTSSQKIYLLCLSGVEGLLSGAQKPLNDHVTNLQLNSEDPSGASPLRDRQAGAVGLGSVDRIAQRQGLSLLYFKAQMRQPWSVTRMLFTVLKKNRSFVNKKATHTSLKVPKLCLQ